MTAIEFLFIFTAALFIAIVVCVITNKLPRPEKSIEKTRGQYNLRNSSDGKFYFVVKAGNGEIIAVSEMYESKQAAQQGIEALQKNAHSEKIVDSTL